MDERDDGNQDGPDEQPECREEHDSEEGNRCEQEAD